jgi:WD40 repeat protein
MARCLDDSLRLWRVGEANPFVVITNRPGPGGLTHTTEFNDDYDFSPDGKLFALGLPGDGLTLHRSADGAEIARWQGGHSFSTARFSPNGKRVAATCVTKMEERQILVFTVPDLVLTNTLTLKESPRGFAWSSDSRILAAATEDSAVVFFDLLDGRLLKTLLCPGLGSGELMFLGDDSLIGVRGSGTTLRLVNPALAAGDLELTGCGQSAISALPAAETFITASVEVAATRWAVEKPAGFQVIPPPRPGGYDLALNACCLDFSPDGRWVVSGHGRFILLRDAVTGRLADELDTGDPKGVEFETVAFCDDGRGVLLLSTRVGLRRRALDFAPDGRPRFGPPLTLDPEAGYLITDHTANAKRFALVDGDRGKVKVIELTAAGAKTLSRWEAPQAYAAALSPDGELALVNCSLGPKPVESAKLRLHRVKDGSLVQELPATADGEVGWSADGATVLTSNGQNESIVWDTATWRPATKLAGRLGGNITSFALAPDSSIAAINRDDSVFLVSPRSGEILARVELPGSSGLSAGIRFLPDKRRFAVLWRDGRIDLIDPAALRAGLKPLGLAW